VARTVDLATHAVRREAFVAGATALFQTRGYEQTSIQDILDEVGTSRGAFYHYFDSKAALLDGVVEQMVDEAMAAVETQLADPASSAVEKLRALFGGIAAWKTEHADLTLAIAEVWLSDHNVLVRERFRKVVAERLVSPLSAILRQGVAEGAFVVEDPEGTAEVLAALLPSLGLMGSELFIARRAGSITYEQAVRPMEALAAAIDRILGADPGTFPRTDERVLRTWFG
jgi:AcrR family transcriptional regulator